MRRRNFTGIVLDPKGGDAGSVSRGVEKSLRAVQRERDDLTTTTRLAIDPTTARKSRKRLGGKLTIPPAHRCAPDTPTTTSVLYVYFTGVTTLCDEVPRGLPTNQGGGVALGESLRLIAAERPH